MARVEVLRGLNIVGSKVLKMDCLPAVAKKLEQAE
jgi:hypothetical protein